MSRLSLSLNGDSHSNGQFLIGCDHNDHQFEGNLSATEWSEIIKETPQISVIVIINVIINVMTISLIESINVRLVVC